jgi:hypothetical protein
VLSGGDGGGLKSILDKLSEGNYKYAMNLAMITTKHIVTRSGNWWWCFHGEVLPPAD